MIDIKREDTQLCYYTAIEQREACSSLDSLAKATSMNLGRWLHKTEITGHSAINSYMASV